MPYQVLEFPHDHAFIKTHQIMIYLWRYLIISYVSYWNRVKSCHVLADNRTTVTSTVRIEYSISKIKHFLKIVWILIIIIATRTEYARYWLFSTNHIIIPHTTFEIYHSVFNWAEMAVQFHSRVRKLLIFSKTYLKSWNQP